MQPSFLNHTLMFYFTRRDVASPTLCQSHMAHRDQAHRGKFTLIKLSPIFTLNMAAERGTADETEATCHCVHNQQRRLEADDCNCTVCTSVTIYFRWEEMPAMPTRLPRSRSPHNVIHLPRLLIFSYVLCTDLRKVKA